MRKGILVILMAFLGGRAFSLELDVEGAVALALEKNLRLQAQKVDQGTLEREKASSWSEFFPDLWAGAGFQYANEPDLLRNAQKSLYLDLGLALELSSKPFFNIQATAKAYEAGKISLEIGEKRLRKEVQIFFYQLLLLEGVIELNREIMDTAEKRYQRAEAFKALGVYSLPQTLSFQIAYESLKPELIAWENLYETSLLEFKQVLGMDLGEELLLRGSIKVQPRSFDPGEFLESFLYNRPEIRYYTKLIEQYEAQRGQAASGALSPVLGVGYTWIPQRFDTEPQEWRDYEGGLRLSLTFPLDGFIPGSQDNLEIRRYDDAIEQGNILLKDMIRTNQVEFQSVVARLNKAVVTLEALDLNYQLAQENFRSTNALFEEGIATFIDVQNVDDELNKAALFIVNEQFNYLAALSELQYLMDYSTQEFQRFIGD